MSKKQFTIDPSEWKAGPLQMNSNKKSTDYSLKELSEMSSGKKFSWVDYFIGFFAVVLFVGIIPGVGSNSKNFKNTKNRFK
jgi:hypothetical protein